MQNLKGLKNIAVIVVLVLAGLYQYLNPGQGTSGSNGNNNTGNNSTPTLSSSGGQAANQQGNQQAVIARIRAAADDPNAKFWTTVGGKVVKNLKDDNDGDRHQKFLVEVSSGITLLVAHNIDLAPRAAVREGDQVLIHAEYVWNNRGGVLHWTHHDPQGRREGGWIEANGRRYE